MNRIEEIDKQIKELSAEKTAIQDACAHPPLCIRYQYDASTGNWDRNSDCYWTNLRCTLCGKRWQVEGSIDPGVGAKKIERGAEL
jgi:hypothetical protein